MKIETKYNIGDTVFTIYQNKIYSGKVRHIQTDTPESGKTRTNYVISGQGNAQSPATCGRDEEEVFGSEAELIQKSKEAKL